MDDRFTLNQLPLARMYREVDLVGKKGKPGILPFGRSTLWAWTKAGKFPKPYRLGPRITAWRHEDIERFLETCSPPSSPVADPDKSGAKTAEASRKLICELDAS